MVNTTKELYVFGCNSNTELIYGDQKHRDILLKLEFGFLLKN